MTFEKEPHRNGQRARAWADFSPEARVVSSALYNSLVDRYNGLLQYQQSLEAVVRGEQGIILKDGVTVGAFKPLADELQAKGMEPKPVGSK